jgi:CRP-like cAMP-binding protein
MKTFPWKDFLQKHTMFSAVRDAKKLEALLEDSASTERRVGPDEVVLRQGEVGDSIYVIGAGSVEAILESGDGTPISLAVMRRSEVFGEMGFIERRPRSATVRAKEPSTVLEIHGPQLRDLMNDHPDLEIRLLLKMRERLRNANEDVLRAQLKTIDEKIDVLNAKLDSEHRPR